MNQGRQAAGVNLMLYDDKILLMMSFVSGIAQDSDDTFENRMII